MLAISSSSPLESHRCDLQPDDAVRDTGVRFGDTLPGMAVLVLLLSIGGISESLRLSSFQNPDIWTHVRTGTWILANKSLPSLGLFSQAAGQPWRAFSWGYDVIAALAYRVLGLRSIPALMITFRISLAASTFALAGGRRNLWCAIALSTVAQFVLSAVGPDSACVTVILFGIELLLLSAMRASSQPRFLFGLLPLFFLWANLDMGFVYGIALLFVFFIAVAMEDLARRRAWTWISSGSARISVLFAVATVTACGLIGMLNPYGYHAYSAFFADQTAAVNSYLAGHAAMSFRQPNDYVLLLLTMTAFLFLGFRHSRDVFQVLVLLGCTGLAFHSQQDNWLVTLVSVSFIGQTLLPSESPVSQGYWLSSKQVLAAGFVAVIMVAITSSLTLPRREDVLEAEIAKYYPLHAADFIRDHRLPAPLFNPYQWGGFLTWYLPEYPVAIDSRRGLYPDQEEVDYFKAMKADIPYQAFPPVRLARTLLFDKVGVLGEALKGLPGFQLAYEDNMSIVLLQPPDK